MYRPQTCNSIRSTQNSPYLDPPRGSRGRSSRRAPLVDVADPDPNLFAIPLHNHAAVATPPPAPIEPTEEDDGTPVRAWLNAEGLSHYAEAVRRHGYTGEACAEVLAELDENNRRLLCSAVKNNSPTPRDAPSRTASSQRAAWPPHGLGRREPRMHRSAPAR